MSTGIVLNGREVTNVVEEFIYGVCGGPTKASHKVDCSVANLYELIRLENARTRDMALRMEAVAAAQGVTMPAAELLALEPWRGPDRHPDAPRRKLKPAANGTATPSRRAAQAPGAEVTALHGSGSARRGKRRSTAGRSRVALISTACRSPLAENLVQKLVGTRCG